MTLLALRESSDAGHRAGVFRAGLTRRRSSVRRSLSSGRILMIWLQACSALTSSPCHRDRSSLTLSNAPSDANATHQQQLSRLHPIHAHRRGVTCQKSVAFYTAVFFFLQLERENNSNRSAFLLRLFGQNQLRGQRQKQKEGKSFFFFSLIKQ